MNTVLIMQLETITNSFINGLDGLSEEELNFHPKDGGWSPGQIGMHVLKSYGLIETLKGNTEPTNRPYDQHCQMLEKEFLNFGVKMKSPEFILPPTTPIQKARLVEGLTNQVNEILDFARTNDLQPSCLDFELPGVGPMTRFEWLFFMDVHTQRHLYQLSNCMKALD